MPLTRLLPLTALVLLSGCLYGVREKTDLVQCDLSLKTYDLAPPGQAAPPRPADAPEKAPPPKSEPPGDVRGGPAAVPTDVQTTALMQAGEPKKPLTPEELANQRLQVPGVIPGSETQLPDFKGMTEEQRREAIKKLFPDLPPLEPEPAAQPGPGGQPYTLADLQLLAARYSPTLKQAASDVEAARGNLLQARTYPNPTIAYEADPSSSGTGGPTFQGVSIDQPIKTAGKLKLQEAAARMEVLNAELALRRARSDLSTQVRNAYFGLLVARESMRINRGVARMTNEVFLIQRDLSESLAAYYEAGTLRAQAGQARLAYQQSLFAYQAAWRTLVAAVGLRERDMPLAEVGGRIDAFVPIYDYDKVLARVLSTHTDVLSAQNGIEKARYSLKLQQITPWFQDMDVQLKVQKDFTTPPGQVVPSVVIGMPLSVWDQNKGNIIAAEAGMVRALEQPHAAELTWTNNVTTAFSNYRQNLKALEDYRRTILPFQVLAYRGVFFRRAQVGGVGRTPVAFADLVTAQQALIQSVSTYLGILGNLWTSVVSVADALQTDDLFQLAEPQSLPPIPDLDHLAPLPCGHECPAGTGAPCGHEIPASPALPALLPEIGTLSEPRAGGIGR
jgi:cobalt-zinc-cadmium efflux system outer membrane protein